MNRRAHALGSGLAVAVATYWDDTREPRGVETVSQRNTKIAAAGGFAAICGSLPDVLEPATHPGHRQFFHSVAFAALLGYELYRTYRWRPDGPLEQLLRGAMLVAGGAYIVHLAMDATTPSSLPQVGRL